MGSKKKAIQPLAFTIRDAAILASISEAFVRKLIRAGKIRAVRVGWVWRIPRAEIERICQEGTA